MRSENDLNNDLSPLYGLPIDVATKVDGLARVARALNESDFVTASIAALHLQLPDPPALEKGSTTADDLFTLARNLSWSSLLKGDWDPDKHPRTGTAPNRGRFAFVPAKPEPPRRGWPSKRASKAIRGFAKSLAKKAPLAELGPIGDVAAFVLEVLEVLMPTELNTAEPNRATDQWYTTFDLPKTLDELQARPTTNVLGYDLHHIVEQNPTNVLKRELEKFGQARLDEADNLVWVPRLKHEWISAYYSEIDDEDPQLRRRRTVVSEMNFDEQRQFGLRELRVMGVLK